MIPSTKQTPAPPDGPTSPAPLGPAAMVAAAAVAAAAGSAVGLAVALAGGRFDREAVMLGAAAAGAALALAAATRFWTVVVVLFAVRSSLDALKLGSYSEGSSALDPAVVVGLVFLLAGSLWLVAQWRAGELRPLSRPTRWFAGLAAAGVLSAAGSGDQVASAQVALKLCAGFLMLAVLEQAYLRRPERIRSILVAGGLSLVVPAAEAVRQLAGPRELEEFLAVSRIRGTFVHPNPFATYLVIVAVVALAVFPHLRGWARQAAGAAVAVAGALTLLTYARGAWAALLVGVVVIGICQDRRLIAVVVAAAVAALIFVPSVGARLSDLNDERVAGQGDPNSLAWRVDYWERLLPLTAENPVTGIGLDQVMARSPERLMPHNSFVQALVETGLLGFTCLVGLCVSTGRALRDAVRRFPPGLGRGVAVGASAAAVGWVLQLVSENLLTQAAVFWYLAGPVAWVLAASARERRPVAVREG